MENLRNSNLNLQTLVHTLKHTQAYDLQRAGITNVCMRVCKRAHADTNKQTKQLVRYTSQIPQCINLHRIAWKPGAKRTHSLSVYRISLLTYLLTL